MSQNCRKASQCDTECPRSSYDSRRHFMTATLAAQNRESRDSRDRRPGIARIPASRSTKVSLILRKLLKHGQLSQPRHSESQPTNVSSYFHHDLEIAQFWIAQFWVARFSSQNRHSVGDRLPQNSFCASPNKARHFIPLPWVAALLHS